MPEWLQRTRPIQGTAFGHETDARQVFRRLAGCWTYWGWKGGYFSTEEDAKAFFDETCYMLAAQMAALLRGVRLTEISSARVRPRSRWARAARGGGGATRWSRPPR